MDAVMQVAPGVGHIELRDIPVPEPAAGQVLLKVRAAGICDTDIHIYLDEYASRPPVVLGHKVSGEVVELGPATSGVEVGDRVTTETYFSTCGRYRYCRAGHINLCLQRLSIGSAINGGFAEFLAVPARNLHQLPNGISFREGALTEPLACVVQGVHLCAPTVRSGDTAVIAGPGVIGLLTLQLLVAAGAYVIVLGTEADSRRLALAEQLGASYIVNDSTVDPVPLVQDLTEHGLGADVDYECSGAGGTAAQLLQLVRRRGRYVQVGLFGKAISWDLDQVCYKELVVTGSNASTPESWLRAIRLLADGTVSVEPPITHAFSLDGWSDAFETLRGKAGINTVFRPHL